MQVIKALYNETVPAFDSLSRVLGVLAAILGTYRRERVLACRPVAEPLRRQGAPRGGAAHLRQPDAKLGADRRRLAAAAPRAQRAAGPDRLDVSHRRLGDRDLDRVVCGHRRRASSALVRSLTGSRTGAILAAALFALNPNVLYLQSTPMTEPLLFALSSLVVLHLAQWAMAETAHPAGRRLDDRGRLPDALRSVADCRRGDGARGAGASGSAARAFARRGRARSARLAIYPALTVVFFMGMSFASTGEWFVTGGFYVPDPKLQGQAARGVATRFAKASMELAGPTLRRRAPTIAARVAARCCAALTRRKWCGDARCRSRCSRRSRCPSMRSSRGTRSAFATRCR